jgi:hypothetical protein
MNPRYRETFRRHRGMFIVPIVVGMVFALWTTLGTPKLYRSSASVWSDVPGDTQSTALGAPPPAAQDQTMLNELLKTNYFAQDVAHGSGLDAYVKSHAGSGWGPFALLKSLKGTPSLNDRIAAALGPKRVTSLVQGPHVLELSVEAPQALLAKKTLDVLIQQFKQQRTQLQEAALFSAQQQVAAATTTLSTARFQLNDYIRSHAGASRADPELKKLAQAEHDAVRQVSGATQSLTQASDSVSNGSVQATLRVLDAPQVPLGPSTGKKKSIESVLAGAFVGLLFSIIGIVVLTKTGQAPAAAGIVEARPTSSNGNGAHPPLADDELVPGGPVDSAPDRVRVE